VDDLTVGLLVLRKTRSAGVLVGIVAGRKAFATVIVRDPHVVLEKARAPHQIRALSGEWERGGSWQELVRRGLSERVLDAVIGDQPVAARKRVDPSMCLHFALEASRNRRKRVAVGVLALVLDRARVDLIHGVRR